MSHLDEGLLTAFLDNELTEAERRSAEAHLAECGECRRLFDELKAFAAEADGLVAAVEVPARTTPSADPLSPAPSPDEPQRGMHRWRTYAWAASVVLALGLGWAASDLRYAPPGERDGLVDRLQERTESASRANDAAAHAAPTLQTPAPATTKETGQTQGPRNRVASGAAKATREEQSGVPVAAADETVRADADRENIPSRPSNKPADAAKLPQDAAPSPDLRGSASFRDASVASGAAPAAAPEPRVQEGVLARRAMTGFRQVQMEEAVRTLGGSIRLMDGLEVERILLGPGSLNGAADPSVALVRVVYEDPPGRELWLDQQRPPFAEQKVGAAYAPLPGDTIMSREGSGPMRVRWIDEHGFRLALTGFLATDSLHAMIRRVH